MGQGLWIRIRGSGRGKEVKIRKELKTNWEF